MRFCASTAAKLDALGATRALAVATSAVRDSANGAEFLRGVEAAFGLETRLLDGDEEARLTRLGVGAVDDGTLVVDVGGGSTELILGAFRVSLDVGSTRLTERFLHSDPPRRGRARRGARARREPPPRARRARGGRRRGHGRAARGSSPARSRPRPWSGSSNAWRR